MRSSHRSVCEPGRLGKWALLGAWLVAALLWFYDPLLILRPQSESDALHLDMATDCIDDMFDGCRAEAASVIDLFGVFEWHFNPNFSFAWSTAEEQVKKLVHKQLREEHAAALYLYTQARRVRRAFDRAVRTGKRKYSTYRFRFHYLYFFLTDAVQALLQNQTSCSVVYHRTGKRFGREVADATMRFGAFTLAESTKPSTAGGNASCFEIHTCFGADITNYSAAGRAGQVLIPPYEVFRITDVRTDAPWCGAVYRLHSTRTPRADLNCKLSSRHMEAYFGLVPRGWRVGRVAQMSTCVVLLVLISAVLVKQKQKRFVVAVLASLLVLIVTAVVLRLSQWL